MTPKEANLIHKFLKINFGNLKLEKKSGETFISLQRDKKTYFIHEQHRNVTQVNLESVVRPIVNMLNTDFEQTNDFVKQWFLKEYEIDNKNN